MSDFSSHVDVEGPPIGTENPSRSRNERSRRPYAHSTSEPSTHFDPGPPPMQQVSGPLPTQVAGRSAHHTGHTDDLNPYSWPRLPRRYAPLGGWTAKNDPFSAVKEAFASDRHVADAAPNRTSAQPLRQPDANPLNPLTANRLPRRAITDLPSAQNTSQPRTAEAKIDPFTNSNGSYYGRQYSQHRAKSASIAGRSPPKETQTAKAQSLKPSSHVGTANLANLFDEVPLPRSTSSSSSSSSSSSPSYSGVFNRLSKAPSQAVNEKVDHWTTQSGHPDTTPTNNQAGVKVLPTHDAAGNLLRHVLVSPGAVLSTDGMVRPGDTMMLHCVAQVQNDRVASLRSQSPRRTYNSPPPISQRKTPSKTSPKIGGSQRGFEADGPGSQHSVSFKDNVSSHSTSSTSSIARVEMSNPTANMPGSFQPEEPFNKSGYNGSKRGSQRSESRSSSIPAASKLGSGSNRSRGSKQSAGEAGGFTEDKGTGSSKKGSDKGGFHADDSGAGGANAGANWN